MEATWLMTPEAPPQPYAWMLMSTLRCGLRMVTAWHTLQECLQLHTVCDVLCMQPAELISYHIEPGAKSLYKDLLTIFRALHAVTNNAPSIVWDPLTSTNGISY